ncbi:MerR family transcriptional regulator [Sediminibacillus massiliensis]|uniref:MerR family transcriptional regulator n=1 Tax=Sediminibacillus massiliensis TaxID=1926277 RepID=UPI0009886FC8|nr:MerR family transcriptional regulator [Sediminibacillus massiliensis]
MTESFLKIEDVAKETGLTKRAIRYYEEIGLISAPQRSERGTRLYTQEEIEKLNKVVLAKEVLGFSLQELQQFIQLDEEIEKRRRDYRQAPGPKKREELHQLSEGLEKQINFIQYKMEKMQNFKHELEELNQRITDFFRQERQD